MGLPGGGAPGSNTSYRLDAILGARNEAQQGITEFNTEIQRAADEIDKLDSKSANIPISVELGDSLTKIDDLERRLKALPNHVTTTVAVDTSGFDTRIDAAQGKVTHFGQTRAVAKADLDSSGVETKADAAQKRVEKFGETKATAHADLEDSAVTRKLAGLEKSLDQFEQIHATAKAELDGKQAEATTAQLNALLDGFEKRVARAHADLDDTPFKQRVTEIQARLDALKGETVAPKADLDTTRLDQKADATQGKLTKINETRAVAKTDVDSANSEAKLQKLDVGLEKIANFTAKATAEVETERGQAALGVLTKQITDFGKKIEKAKADVDTLEGLDHVLKLEAELDKVRGTVVKAKADADTAGATGKLAFLRALMAKISGEKVKVSADVDQSKFQEASKSLDNVKGKIDELSKAATDIAGNIKKYLIIGGIGAIPAVATQAVVGVVSLSQALTTAAVGFATLGGTVEAGILALRGMVPLIKQIGSDAQNGAFATTQWAAAATEFNGRLATLTNDFKALIDNVGGQLLPVMNDFLRTGDQLLPVFAVPLDHIIQEVGRAAEEFLYLATQHEQLASLQEVLMQIGYTAGRLVEIATQLGLALVNVAKEALPYGNLLLTQIDALTASFRIWTQTVEGQKALDEFFNHAAAAAYNLVVAVGNVVAGLFHISQAINASGLTKFLTVGLYNASEQFLAMARAASVAGGAVEKFAQDAQPVLQAMGELLVDIAKEWLVMAQAVAEAKDSATGLSIIVEILDAIRNALPTIGDLFTSTFITIGPSIAALIPQVAAFLDVFKSATPVIARFLDIITLLLSAFNSLPDPIKSNLAIMIEFGAVSKVASLALSVLGGSLSTLGTVAAFAFNPVAKLSEAFAGLKTAAAAIRDAELVSYFTALPSLITGAVTAFKVFIAALLDGQKVMEALRAAWVALDVVMDVNPIGVIVVALAALAVGLYEAYQHSETFRNAVNALWEGIKAVAGAIGSFASSVASAVASAASAVGGFVSRVVSGLGTIAASFKPVLDDISGGNWAKAWSDLVTIANYWLETLKRTVLTKIIDALGPIGGQLFIDVYTKNWSGLWSDLNILAGRGLDLVKSTIASKIKDALGPIGSTLATDVYTGNWSKLWTDLTNVASQRLDVMKNVIQNKVTQALGPIAGQLVDDAYRGHWSAFWADLNTIASHGLDVIRATVLAKLEQALGPLGGQLLGEAYQGNWSAFWADLNTIASRGLDRIKSTISSKVRDALNGVKSGLGDEAVKGNWKAFFDDLNTIAIQQMGKVRTQISSDANKIGPALSKALDQARQSARQTLSGLSTDISNELDKLPAEAGKAVGGFVGVMVGSFARSKVDSLAQIVGFKDDALSTLTTFQTQGVDIFGQFKTLSGQQLIDFATASPTDLAALKAQGGQVIADFVSDNVSKLLSFKTDGGQHLYDFATSSPTDLAALKAQGGQVIADFVSDNIDKLLSFKTDGGQSLLDFATSSPTDLVALKAQAGQVITDFVTNALSSFSDLKSSGESLFQEMADALGQQAEQMVANLIQQFLDLANRGKQIISDFVSNAISSFEEMASETYKHSIVPDMRVAIIEEFGKMSVGVGEHMGVLHEHVVTQFENARKAVGGSVLPALSRDIMTALRRIPDQTREALKELPERISAPFREGAERSRQHLSGIGEHMRDMGRLGGDHRQDERQRDERQRDRHQHEHRGGGGGLGGLGGLSLVQTPNGGALPMAHMGTANASGQVQTPSTPSAPSSSAASSLTPSGLGGASLAGATPTSASPTQDPTNPASSTSPSPTAASALGSSGSAGQPVPVNVVSIAANAAQAGASALGGTGADASGLSTTPSSTPATSDTTPATQAATPASSGTGLPLNEAGFPDQGAGMALAGGPGPPGGGMGSSTDLLGSSAGSSSASGAPQGSGPDLTTTPWAYVSPIFSSGEDPIKVANVWNAQPLAFRAALYKMSKAPAAPQGYYYAPDYGLYPIQSQTSSGATTSTGGSSTASPGTASGASPSYGQVDPVSQGYSPSATQAATPASSTPPTPADGTTPATSAAMGSSASGVVPTVSGPQGPAVPVVVVSGQAPAATPSGAASGASGTGAASAGMGTGQGAVQALNQPTASIGQGSVAASNSLGSLASSGANSLNSLLATAQKHGEDIQKVLTDAYKALRENSLKEFQALSEGGTTHTTNLQTNATTQHQLMGTNALAASQGMNQNVTGQITDMANQGTTQTTALQTNATQQHQTMQQNAINAVQGMHDTNIQSLTDLQNQGTDQATQLQQNTTNQATQLQQNATNQLTQAQQNGTNQLTTLQQQGTNQSTALQQNMTSQMTGARDNTISALTSANQTGTQQLQSLQSSGTTAMQQADQQWQAPVGDAASGVQNYLNDMLYGMAQVIKSASLPLTAPSEFSVRLSGGVHGFEEGGLITGFATGGAAQNQAQAKPHSGASLDEKQLADVIHRFGATFDNRQPSISAPHQPKLHLWGEGDSDEVYLPKNQPPDRAMPLLGAAAGWYGLRVIPQSQHSGDMAADKYTEKLRASAFAKGGASAAPAAAPATAFGTVRSNASSVADVEVTPGAPVTDKSIHALLSKYGSPMDNTKPSISAPHQPRLHVWGEGDNEELFVPKDQPHDHAVPLINQAASWYGMRAVKEVPKASERRAQQLSNYFRARGFADGGAAIRFFDAGGDSSSGASGATDSSSCDVTSMLQRAEQAIGSDYVYGDSGVFAEPGTGYTCSGLWDWIIYGQTGDPAGAGTYGWDAGLPGWAPGPGNIEIGVTIGGGGGLDTTHMSGDINGTIYEADLYNGVTHGGFMGGAQNFPDVWHLVDCGAGAGLPPGASGAGGPGAASIQPLIQKNIPQAPSFSGDGLPGQEATAIAGGARASAVSVLSKYSMRTPRGAGAAGGTPASNTIGGVVQATWGDPSTWTEAEAIAYRESGGVVNAVNPDSGAGGLFGFMPSTASAIGADMNKILSDATYASQEAYQLYQQMGWSPWAGPDWESYTGHEDTPITSYLNGGIATSPQLATMAEQGPEMVIPLSDPTAAQRFMDFLENYLLQAAQQRFQSMMGATPPGLGQRTTQPGQQNMTFASPSHTNTAQNVTGPGNFVSQLVGGQNLSADPQAQSFLQQHAQMTQASQQTAQGVQGLQNSAQQNDPAQTQASQATAHNTAVLANTPPCCPSSSGAPPSTSQGVDPSNLGNTAPQGTANTVGGVTAQPVSTPSSGVTPGGSNSNTLSSNLSSPNQGASGASADPNALGGGAGMTDPSALGGGAGAPSGSSSGMGPSINLPLMRQTYAMEAMALKHQVNGPEWRQMFSLWKKYSSQAAPSNFQIQGSGTASSAGSASGAAGAAGMPDLQSGLSNLGGGLGQFGQGLSSFGQGVQSLGQGIQGGGLTGAGSSATGSATGSAGLGVPGGSTLGGSTGASSQNLQQLQQQHDTMFNLEAQLAFNKSEVVGPAWAKKLINWNAIQQSGVLTQQGQGGTGSSTQSSPWQNSMLQHTQGMHQQSQRMAQTTQQTAQHTQQMLQPMQQTAQGTQQMVQPTQQAAQNTQQTAQGIQQQTPIDQNSLTANNATAHNTAIMANQPSCCGTPSTSANTLDPTGLSQTPAQSTSHGSSGAAFSSPGGTNTATPVTAGGPNSTTISSQFNSNGQPVTTTGGMGRGGGGQPGGSTATQTFNNTSAVNQVQRHISNTGGILSGGSGGNLNFNTTGSSASGSSAGGGSNVLSSIAGGNQNAVQVSGSSAGGSQQMGGINRQAPGGLSGGSGANSSGIAQGMDLIEEMKIARQDRKAALHERQQSNRHLAALRKEFDKHLKETTDALVGALQRPQELSDATVNKMGGAVDKRVNKGMKSTSNLSGLHDTFTRSARKARLGSS